MKLKFFFRLLLCIQLFTLSTFLSADGEPLVEDAIALVEAEAEAVDSSTFEKGYEHFMETPDAGFFTVSNLWLLIAAALVFIMHLGFATVESGLSQSKNTVNILFKNCLLYTSDAADD